MGGVNDKILRDDLAYIIARGVPSMRLSIQMTQMALVS